MIPRLIGLSLSILVCHSFQSHDLTREDFRVGGVHLDQPIDSALQVLGRLNRIDTTITEAGNFAGYSFDGMTIWVNTARTISAIDISSNSYRTRKGVTIGDSLSTIEQLYGVKKEWAREKELGRMYEIYDTTFSDFDFLFDYEFRTSDYDACYIAFYFKSNRVVKIYMWRGLTD
jgi:hypothetical protein